ncbi:tsr1 ribosome assembly factor isoform X2 [Lycorma delicatula]|uniref:tsr1 ribosome assembly factor isoform X2 n=1 Tax=Lycorma delicatula TaxID=130591 RepID=UPI003F50EE89
MVIGDGQQVTHRPGYLKQQNKLHKHGRHRSKGSVDNLNKGRVPVKTCTKKNRQLLKKEERRNQVAQLRNKKRADYLQKRRGFHDAPHLVAVVALSQSIQYDKVFELLETADNEAILRHTPENHTHISVPRFRQRFTFVRVNRDELFNVLDVLKTVDTVLFVVSVLGIDDWGDVLVTSILAQGLPTCAVALVGLELVLPKKKQESKSQIQKAINHWLPEEKINVLEKDSDALNLLRRIGNQKQRNIVHRDRHSYLLGEAVSFLSNEQSGKGVLKVTGYLRGQPLSVNSLVHIPGWGDFQMKQIDAPTDINPLTSKSRDADMFDEQDIKVLEVSDPSKQESLDSENILDPMDAEQTWPTEEELAEANEERKIKKVKKVPQGMSEYQAAWIPDVDADVEDSEDDDENADKMEMDAAESYESDENDAKSEAMESVTVSEVPFGDERYDKEVNFTEEEETLKKIREARVDKMFPDEIDTPIDVAARERFQKYRGLKSFRTSLWDTKEDLPSDYARIFQFQNFNRTKKRIIHSQEEIDGAQPGWYITVHVDNVPEELYNTKGEQPIVLYGMLPHEQKMSVLNMVLKRPNISTESAPEPIKSKEQLIFQCGYRRFKASPIFSQHTNGSKHKYERYFQTEGNVVATVYAPIMFPPCSVLAFQEKGDGSMPLVATGSLLSVNPDRLIIKRVVLSGHPFKVHKRSAVIRFMFFNREDINWFKPIELRTKYGRRGHIKEPLGTHGHMKCIFDGQLKSQDTVLLNLYKRVFPRWSYDPHISTNVKDKDVQMN